MSYEDTTLGIDSLESFAVTFESEILDSFPKSGVSKVAVLVTSEYESFFQNGGVGTYYATLSQELAAEGWYVILILAYTDLAFHGLTNQSSVKHIFSAQESERVLRLGPVHKAILAHSKSEDKRLGLGDSQSFSCLFFIQALVAAFREARIYVEFPELLGIGYRTIQAKRSGLLEERCVTAVTLHGGHEWIFESNERYAEEHPSRYWQISHFEQRCFEDADLVFYPSCALKSRVEKYGWMTEHAHHLPYFVPIMETSSAKNQTRTKTDYPPEFWKIPLVFYGRLEERKGLCEFVEAIKLLEPRWQDRIHAIFLGKSVQLQSTRLHTLQSREYITQELHEKCSFSLRTDLYREQAIEMVRGLSSPIICLASVQENFPNSALEMGQLPVRLIVSDTGGFREALMLVGRTEQIHWFRPRSARSLAIAITEALSHPSEPPSVSSREFLGEVNDRLRSLRQEYIAKAFVSSRQVTERSPKVTVGVTCYNLGKYLPECLQSIQSQTYENLQVLVLDDASSDEETKEILAKAKQRFPDFEFMRSECNLGLGAARNRLIDLAQGEYFLTLDADNVALPFLVEKLLAGIQESGAAICVCPQMRFDAKAETIINFSGGSLPILLEANRSGDACSLFSLELLRQLRHCEDREVTTHDWQILAAAQAMAERTAYFPYPLYKYRIRENGMSRNGNLLTQRYHLRHYLASVPPAKWSRRELYMLLTAAEQLIHSQGHLHRENEALTQLHLHMLEVIKGMESTKFWKLREAWFRLKRVLGLAKEPKEKGPLEDVRRSGRFGNFRIAKRSS